MSILNQEKSLINNTLFEHHNQPTITINVPSSKGTAEPHVARLKIAIYLRFFLCNKKSFAENYTKFALIFFSPEM